MVPLASLELLVMMLLRKTVMGSVLLFADDSIAVVVVTLELARKLLHTSPVKVAMVVWRATTHSTLKPMTQKGRVAVYTLLLQ